MDSSIFGEGHVLTSHHLPSRGWVGMGALWARREKKFGKKLIIFAFFGQIERNKTEEPLKGSKHTIQSFKDSLITNLYMQSHGYLLVDDQTGP